MGSGVGPKWVMSYRGGYTHTHTYILNFPYENIKRFVTYVTYLRSNILVYIYLKIIKFPNNMQLAANAHTICDSELRPLGTGLYPVISIINHR